MARPPANWHRRPDARPGRFRRPRVPRPSPRGLAPTTPRWAARCWRAWRSLRSAPGTSASRPGRRFTPGFGAAVGERLRGRQRQRVGVRQRSGIKRKLGELPCWDARTGRGRGHRVDDLGHRRAVVLVQRRIDLALRHLNGPARQRLWAHRPHRCVVGDTHLPPWWSPAWPLRWAHPT